MVTVTATCSRVFIPDWFRSATETGGETGANQKIRACGKIRMLTGTHLYLKYSKRKDLFFPPASMSFVILRYFLCSDYQ